MPYNLSVIFRLRVGALCADSYGANETGNSIRQDADRLDELLILARQHLGDPGNLRYRDSLRALVAELDGTEPP